MRRATAPIVAAAFITKRASLSFSHRVCQLTSYCRSSSENLHRLHNKFPTPRGPTTSFGKLSVLQIVQR